MTDEQIDRMAPIWRDRKPSGRYAWCTTATTLVFCQCCGMGRHT